MFRFKVQVLQAHHHRPCCKKLQAPPVTQTFDTFEYVLYRTLAGGERGHDPMLWVRGISPGLIYPGMELIGFNYSALQHQTTVWPTMVVSNKTGVNKSGTPLVNDDKLFKVVPITPYVHPPHGSAKLAGDWMPYAGIRDADEQPVMFLVPCALLEASDWSSIRLAVWEVKTFDNLERIGWFVIAFYQYAIPVAWDPITMCYKIPFTGDESLFYSSSAIPFLDPVTGHSLAWGGTTRTFPYDMNTDGAYNMWSTTV